MFHVAATRGNDARPQLKPETKGQPGQPLLSHSRHPGQMPEKEDLFGSQHPGQTTHSYLQLRLQVICCSLLASVFPVATISLCTSRRSTLGFHLCKMVWCLSVYDWLISVSIMASKFIHVFYRW